MSDSLITILPEELLLIVLKNLDARDLLSLSLTCKAFYELSHAFNSLWSNIILKDFSIKRETDTTPLPDARLYYMKVLRKYGRLSGLWKAKSLSEYGGVMLVTAEPSRIVGFELRPPRSPHVMLPLRKIETFEIRLDEPKKVAVLNCLLGREKHGVTIEGDFRNRLCTDVFSRQCQSRSEHKGVDEYTQDDLVSWLNEELDMNTEGGFLAHRMFILKFLSIKQYEYKGSYSRLKLPEVHEEARFPIQPGIFKGTYSAHGLEILSLSYNLECTKMEAVKITGDPNIPTGKISLRSDIRYAMLLTADQQQSFDVLESVHAGVSEIPWDEMPPLQPFKVPQGCVERHSVGIPDYCIRRFHGFGQIASTGFQNPSFTPGHWIIFSEDLFAFIWMDLKSLSLYHRVHPDELQ